MTGVLAGRKAIVTGGNRGLGLEIARRFVAAGADVAIGARDEALVNTEVGRLADVRPDGRVVGRKLNVASETDCQAFVEWAIGELGCIRRAGQQRRHPWPDRAPRVGRLDEVGGSNPNQSAGFSHDGKSDSRPHEVASSRRNHSAFRRWRNQSPPKHFGLRGVEGCGGPFRGIPRTRRQGLRH